MSKYAINPNALPDPAAEERAAIARDHAFIEDGDAGGARNASKAPLPPMMSSLPDPRFPHGMIDEVEQRLAEIRAAKAAETIAKAPEAAPEPEAPEVAPRKAMTHPLVISLMAALPEPGAIWSAKERADWLLAAESIFHLVYKADARLNVEPDAA